MNNDVIKVIAAEWLKLKRRRTTLMIPLIVGFVTVVLLLGLDFAARRQWIGIPSGFYLATVTMEWIVNVAILVAVVATCFHISREFSWGTVKSAWVRPVTRCTWFTGKVLSAHVAIAALFLFSVAIVIVLSALRFGFTDLVEGNYLVHSAGSMGWRIALTIGLSIWVLWATTAVAAMLAVFFNHPGGAIATSLGLGFGMVVLAIFPSVKPYLLSSFVSMPTDQMIAMAKGLPLPLTWGQLVWHTLVGAGIWMVVALTIGYVFIERKEITF
jgi:ABC-type transport system involved in multi-copper enzyme maturation permease subunit